jgi:hypothetical protein
MHERITLHHSEFQGDAKNVLYVMGKLMGNLPMMGNLSLESITTTTHLEHNRRKTLFSMPKRITLHHPEFYEQFKNSLYLMGNLMGNLPIMGNLSLGSYTTNFHIQTNRWKTLFCMPKRITLHHAEFQGDAWNSLYAMGNLMGKLPILGNLSLGPIATTRHIQDNRSKTLFCMPKRITLHHPEFYQQVKKSLYTMGKLMGNHGQFAQVKILLSSILIVSAPNFGNGFLYAQGV